MGNRDSQMSQLIARSQEWVGEKGTHPETLEDRDYIHLASLGWLRGEVRSSVAWPLWGIALGVVGNGVVQAAKWILG